LDPNSNGSADTGQNCPRKNKEIHVELFWRRLLELESSDSFEGLFKDVWDIKKFFVLKKTFDPNPDQQNVWIRIEIQ
jgi:hypothetical protein